MPSAGVVGQIGPTVGRLDQFPERLHKRLGRIQHRGYTRPRSLRISQMLLHAVDIGRHTSMKGWYTDSVPRFGYPLIGADRELKLAGSGRLRPKRAGPAVRIHLAPPSSPGLRGFSGTFSEIAPTAPVQRNL